MNILPTLLLVPLAALAAVPTAPAPRPLTLQVFIAITRSPNELHGLPAMGQRPIPVEGLRVQSERGRVVLDGAVRREEDSAEAEARAEAIVGVGNVVNRIAVRP